MPLNKSGSQQSVGQNISQLQKDGYPHKQSIAIAMDIQRRAGMANGGAPPWFVRSEAHDMDRYGMVHGATPGRADLRPTSVRGGSYIVPADIVSSLGQGNSLAGANSLNRILKMGPYGTQTPRMPSGHTPMPRGHFAGGGEVPIKVSDGEFKIPPEKVAEIGGGDLQHGHDILDHVVMTQRRKAIQHLSSLPPPRDSNQESGYDAGGQVGGPVVQSTRDYTGPAFNQPVGTQLVYTGAPGGNPTYMPYDPNRGGPTPNDAQHQQSLDALAVGFHPRATTFADPLLGGGSLPSSSGSSGGAGGSTSTTPTPQFPTPIIPNLDAILGQQIPGPGPSSQNTSNNSWQNSLPFPPSGQYSPYPQYPQYAPGAPQANLAQATAPQIPQGQQGAWWTGSQNPWWIGNANGGRIRRYQTGGPVSESDRQSIWEGGDDTKLNQASSRPNWMNAMSNYMSYATPTPYERNQAQDARAYATGRLRRPYGFNE